MARRKPSLSGFTWGAARAVPASVEQDEPIGLPGVQRAAVARREAVPFARAAMAIRDGRAVPPDDLAAIWAWLREAMAGEPDDAKARQRLLRKRLMRRLAFEHYRDEARTAAAKLIAAAWALHRGDGGEALPGTPSEFFDRLAREGVSPAGWRTIADDLDSALD